MSLLDHKDYSKKELIEIVKIQEFEYKSLLDDHSRLVDNANEIQKGLRILLELKL